MRMRTKSLLVILLASALTGSVWAIAYVVLPWTTTATVVANPSVCFVDWADGTTKANTFDYDVNIFPSIITIDENITYGIWNWDTDPHNVSMRILTITSNSTNVDEITTYVTNATGDIEITVTWSSGGPTVYQQFTAAATSKYTIWTEITGKGGASGSSVITYNMKVENP
jgi:hypothetical protein